MLKYYVNLPNDASKRHGKRVSLEATTNNLTEDDAALSEWWVEGHANNTNVKYLSRSTRARARRKYAINEKNKFRNTVLLPHVGGDKYTVKCSKKDDRSNAKVIEEIEIWRKIFYTVHYMNNDCLNIFNGVKAKLEAAFIEGHIELDLASSSPTQRIENHTRTEKVFTLYKNKPELKDKPFHLRIVVLNDVYDLKERKYKQIFSGSGLGKGTIRTVNLLSDETAKHWRTHATATIAGIPGSIDIKHIVTKVNDTTIECDFSKDNTVHKALQDGKKITVTLKTREREHFLGFSFKNICVVRINESKTPAEIMKTVLQTFTHEIGHGVQQVVEKERLYADSGAPLGWERNPTWHTDEYGGQGPHCNINAKLVATTTNVDEGGTTSGKIYTHNSGTLCTMFFSDESHVDPNGKFCVNCLPRLRRVNISAEKMKSRGWDTY